MRQGLYYAIGAIGVGIGMLTTGNFLKLNGNLLSRFSAQASINSIGWIGAWWLIYMPTALINLILAFLVSLFSSSLTRFHYKKSMVMFANAEMSSSANTSSLESNDIQSERQKPNRLSPMWSKFSATLLDFLRSARLIWSNRIFVFIVLCTTTETFLIKGFSSYLSKYLEYQYRLSASTATMMVGGIGFVSLMLGVFFGSFLVKHFKWQVSNASHLYIIRMYIKKIILRCVNVRSS